MTDLVRRPQPLGAFPLPCGYFLLPDEPGVEAARISMLTGRVPAEWPAALTGHRLALTGDVEAAEAFFAKFDDPVQTFNRYVCNPAGIDAGTLRNQLGKLGALVDLVDFATGDAARPPELGQATGEIAAMILSAQAAFHLVRNPVRARTLLSRALDAVDADCIAFRAALLADRARTQSDARAALDDLGAGLNLLAGSDLVRTQADLHVAAAACRQQLAEHEPSLVREAVADYHRALALIDREADQEVFATCHVNLATCYLTMPMASASPALRYGVAVQSLRAALEVFTPQAYPSEWASTTLNLANALVYAPSSHPEQNLGEAIELYRQVAHVRDPACNPAGYARVRANLGNALAHAGVWDEALAELEMAIEAFERIGQREHAADVRALADQVREHSATARAGGGAAGGLETSSSSGGSNEPGSQVPAQSEPDGSARASRSAGTAGTANGQRRPRLIPLTDVTPGRPRPAQNPPESTSLDADFWGRR